MHRGQFSAILLCSVLGQTTCLLLKHLNIKLPELPAALMPSFVTEWLANQERFDAFLSCLRDDGAFNERASNLTGL